MLAQGFGSPTLRVVSRSWHPQAAGHERRRAASLTWSVSPCWTPG